MNTRTGDDRRLLELGADSLTLDSMNANTIIELCKSPWFEKAFGLAIGHAGYVLLDSNGMFIRLSLSSIDTVYGVEAVTICGDRYERAASGWQYVGKEDATSENDESYDTGDDFISGLLDDEVKHAVNASKESHNVLARKVFSKNVKIEWSNWIDEMKHKKQEQFYDGLLSIIDMVSLASKINVNLEFTW